MKQVQDYIRTIVDFPHEGIMFRDVTTLFADPRGFRMAIDQMLHPYAGEQIYKREVRRLLRPPGKDGPPLQPVNNHFLGLYLP